MKIKVLLSMLGITLLLISCTPTSAPTPTITAVATIAMPLPDPITGTIFWDANGSGLQDDTSFIVSDFDPADPPYFFQLLAANGTGLGNLSPGELATVPEPPIPSISVCLGDICTETGVVGTFTLQPEKAQSTYYLTFTDPHADDPIRAFRYINKWNGPVVIESYEINGVTVPEQHLNDTKVMEIAKGISTSAEDSLIYGLMQGFLTLPFSGNYFHIYNWVDYDPNLRSIRIYTGSSDFDENTYQYKTHKVIPAITDGHPAVDFGIRKGALVYATVEGDIRETYISDNGDGGVLADTLVSSKRFRLGYSHQNFFYISPVTFVFRGQLLSSPKKFDELEINIYVESVINEPCIYFDKDREDRKKEGWASHLDPYRDISNPDCVSYWTVDNIPQFPLVKIIE